MRKEYGPERMAGQGLDPNQYQSGDRTIAALLGRAPARDHTDLVITWRNGAYEVWASRGMIRFKRYADEAGNLQFCAQASLAGRGVRGIGIGRGMVAHNRHFTG